MLALERLRNIGISAHIDSGKTTLTERMLYYSGRIRQMHEVRGTDGIGAVMDSDPIERRRGITISSAVTSVGWKDHTIQIIDTPGHVDFTVEVERSLRVLDGAVLVLCSVGGVQSQSITVDRQMRRYGIPRLAVINKMDRAGADPDRVLGELQERLAIHAVPLQLPLRTGDEFDGVVDLVTMEKVTFQDEFGRLVLRENIPSELLTVAREARQRMLESVSTVDDEVLAMLIEGIEPSVEQLRKALRTATLAHRVVPVLFAAAACNVGVQEVLDAVNFYLPSPLDRSVQAMDLRKEHATDGDDPTYVALEPNSALPAVAMAYKTVVEEFGPVTFIRIYQGTMRRGEVYFNPRTCRRHRFARLVRMHADSREEIESAGAGELIGVIGLDSALGDSYCGGEMRVAFERIVTAEPVVQMTIEPVRSQDADLLMKTLDRFRRQDPTFRFATDAESNQLVIAGVGRLQLDVYVERLREEVKCDVRTGSPHVAYREHPTRSVEFQYRLRKQNGGQGQFAQITCRFEPLAIDAQNRFEFVDETSGGRVSKAFVAAVREGALDALGHGLIGEFPVMGVRLVLLDGLVHEKDSSELAFRRCAFEAIRQEALPQSKLELIEPVVVLTIETPSEFQGAVVGSLIRKRGSVSESEVMGETCHLKATVPLAEVLNYADELRSQTRGQGTFSMSPAGYRPAAAERAASCVRKQRQTC